MKTGQFGNKSDIENAANAYYKRLYISHKYEMAGNVNCPVILIKAMDKTQEANILEDDYGLNKVGSIPIGLILTKVDAQCCISTCSKH